MSHNDDAVGLPRAPLTPMNPATLTPMNVELAKSGPRDYRPGRSLAARAVWWWIEAALMRNPVVTSYRLKRTLLRRFGASVGAGVIIKPSVHIKHPWRLRIGDHCWIGERVWIDNLVDVDLADNVCISQDAYLCTGNHDWSDPRMGMTPAPIEVEHGAWIGARSTVGPGVTVGRGAVLTLGCVLLSDAEPQGIYAGNPAQRIGTRKLQPIGS